MNMNRFCVIGLPRRITHHQSIDAWTSNGGIRIAMPCQTTHDMGVHFGQKRGRMAVACQAYPNGPWVRRYTQRWHAHKRLMENRCVESYLVYLRKTNEWATMADEARAQQAATKAAAEACGSCFQAYEAKSEMVAAITRNRAPQCGMGGARIMLTATLACNLAP